MQPSQPSPTVYRTAANYPRSGVRTYGSLSPERYQSPSSRIVRKEEVSRPQETRFNDYQTKETPISTAANSRQSNLVIEPSSHSTVRREVVSLQHKSVREIPAHEHSREK